MIFLQISNVASVESLSIYQQSSKTVEISHQLAYNSSLEKNRIAQLNFQLPYNLQNQNLSQILPNIYNEGQTFMVKRISDESIINPSFPAYNSQALQINITNSAYNYATIYQKFTNNLYVQNVSAAMIFSGNIKSFIFYFLRSDGYPVFAVNGDFTNQRLTIYYIIGGTFSSSLILQKFFPLQNTYQRGYIQFTNLNNKLNINWIAANSTTWINENSSSTNFHADSITTTMNSLLFRISNDLGSSNYIYACDSNYYLSPYAYNFTTYEVKQQTTNPYPFKIDYDYYTNKSIQFSNFMNGSIPNLIANSFLNYSTNESIEFYNYNMYQNYWTNSHYHILERDSIKSNLIANYKNGFVFDSQLRLGNRSYIQFIFGNQNFSIEGDPLDSRNLSIYNSNIKISSINCINLANNYAWFRDISLRVEFFNKNLRICILGNDSYYNFYFYVNSELSNISFFTQSESAGYEGNFNSEIHLKYLNFTKSISEIKLYSNKSKFAENQIYSSDRLNDNYEQYIFVDSIIIDSISNPYSSEISINDTTFYFERIRIALIDMNVYRNYTEGYHRIEENGKIYPVMAYGQTTERLQFFNDYNGFSNTSFLDTNGGYFDFITTINSPTFSTSFLNISIIIIYEFRYLTNPAIEFYFNKGMEILLPITILGMFTLGLYSKGKSKYFAGFGLIVGLLVLYLIGMISLLLFIFMLFLSIFAFYIIIKHERSDM